MRYSTLTVILGLWLAVAACSKPTQEKTSQDLKAVGSEVGSAAKQVAATPAAKALGSDFKQGANEAAAKTKVAADQAGEKLKAGAATAGDKLKAGAKDAGDRADAAVNRANEKADSK